MDRIYCSPLDKLHRIFQYRCNPWGLEFTENCVNAVTLRNPITALASYVKSFFTNTHVNSYLASARKYAALLEKKRSSRMNEEERIAVEKTRVLGLSELHRKEDAEEVEIAKVFATRSDGLMRPLYDGRYRNHHNEGIFTQAFESFKTLFYPRLGPRNTNLDNVSELMDTWKPLARTNGCEITWIGHETILIQLDNFNILTDPIFGSASLFFPRYTPPGIEIQRLPLIDVIALSHNHHDHADNTALAHLLEFQPLVIVPERMGDWVRSFGYEKVSENRWWDKTVMTKRVSGKTHKIEIYSVPAIHNSQRTGDFNRSLWQGVVIVSGNTKIYFAGDTALNEEMFAQIKEKFGELDIAFLPIAPEGEDPVHINARQALQIFKDHIKAKTMFPVHWGTFRQSRRTLEYPIEMLRELLQEDEFAGVKSRVIIPKIGKRYSKDDL